jgi:hypothetical protein
MKNNNKNNNYTPDTYSNDYCDYNDNFDYINTQESNLYSDSNISDENHNDTFTDSDICNNIHSTHVTDTDHDSDGDFCHDYSATCFNNEAENKDY